MDGAVWVDWLFRGSVHSPQHPTGEEVIQGGGDGKGGGGDGEDGEYEGGSSEGGVR